MKELQKYLERIDQTQYDKWLDGRYSVAELIKDHKMIALMFRNKILDAIEDHTPSEMISLFNEKCSEIDIKDHREAKKRVEEECKEIKKIL